MTDETTEDEKDVKDNEQTAVEDANDESNETSSEDKDSTAQEGDDLDDILAEFDSKKEAKDDKGGTKADNKAEQSSIDANALATLESQINEINQREARRELEGIFSQLSDGVEADEVDAEAFLNTMALRDPRLNEIYASRGENPKAWNKVFGALKQDFTKRFGKKVDKRATESRDAAASAVRSASTAASDDGLTDKDVRTMSKSDFDEAQRKLGVTPI